MAADIVNVDGCPFCDIAKGIANAETPVLWTDEQWIAFFPLNPATPGHTLIIPRTHVRDLWDTEPVLGSELMHAAIKVGNAIESALKPEGMNLISSAGKVAEQSVFHLHLHLVPRWKKDGFGEIWPANNRYEDAELGDVASLIREAIPRTVQS